MNGVTVHYRGGYKVLEIDTKKASYMGLNWRDLGAFGKKKFENITFIQNARSIHPVEGTKVIYI